MQLKPERFNDKESSNINPEHGTPETPIWDNQFGFKTWDQAESDFFDVIVRA